MKVLLLVQALVATSAGLKPLLKATHGESSVQPVTCKYRQQ